MAKQVVNGAELACTFGMSPSTLIVLPVHQVFCVGQPAATIDDHVPIENIPTFGMCTSLANPEVAAATSAAMGVLTPMPCIPATSTPWMPGALTTTFGDRPALLQTDMCMCQWAGEISITYPGQETVDVE